MFAEEVSESPRMPSPWRAIDSPSSSRGSPTRCERMESSTLSRLLAEQVERCLSLEDSERTSLTPESDTTGHIEYKLKLVNPTPMRLAKLITQLKWRTVEGGGIAIYELGVLDDGKLIGISRSEMKASLVTLGRMLSGIGGGVIEISRVVRLGGEEDDEACDEESESDRDGFNVGNGDRNGLNAGFESFEVVDAGENQFLKDPPPIPAVVIPVLLPKPVQPIQIIHHAPRTQAERDEIRNAKRNARRAKRQAEGLPQLWNDDNPDYVRPVKLKKAPTPGPQRPKVPDAECLLLKPRLPDACDGARFVIEAIVVTKRDREESVVEEEGEGWRYLDFASSCSL